jgi:hydroxymethylpyrimidine kinase/phosphomethylpyrimidine kinase
LKRTVRVALTVAGSDSGGGAGIQADLKTFAALGVHGTSAITVITAQNTEAVGGVQTLEPDFVAEQIRMVADDIGVDAAKTGMLYSAPMVSRVARVLGKYEFPIVVDPVMVSKAGAPLLEDEAVETLKKELLPIATVVTPNVQEAERLTGRKIASADDAKRAAKEVVRELDARSCVVKGGHLGGAESRDLLYVDGRYVELEATRIHSKATHGTGCVFSAAIAAELAKGNTVIDSVKKAKELVTVAIDYGLPLGRGYGPVNPSSWAVLAAEKWRVMENLAVAARILQESKTVYELVPEVQMNMAMALPYPYMRGKGDVAAFPGRIVKIGKRVEAFRPPAFGASSHVASAVMKAMEFDGEVRAAANIRYSKEILEAAKRLGFVASLHDRRKEPKKVKETEGASVPWGVEKAIRSAGRIPDIIYDLGDWGKEPLIRVFGRDAVDVAKKIVRIADATKGSGDV